MKKWFLGFILFTVLSVRAQLKSSEQVLVDSVVFNSADNKISFGGTLTMLKGKKSFATLVMISGTGKQDRDGTMAGHKMFLDIANYLALNGIAMLRVDDRGVGKTTGVYEKATTADFADDAIAAVNYLKSRKDIDASKIGLIGHSEGGVAMAIAATKSKDIHFLISIAGLASSGLAAQLKQNEDLVAASALPDYDKKRSNEVNAIMFKTAYQYAASDSMEVKLNETYQVWKVKDDAYFKTLNKPFDHFRFPIYSYVQNSIQPWYRFFIRYDAAKTIAQIKVPILALNGDRDLMVAAEQNLANWKNYAAQGGNKQVTTVKLPGLNHLFLPCKTCDMAENAKIKADFSPEALEIIKNWIFKTVH
jgi:pimeloyl-ACP methyl ester carboxylesterase